MDYFLSAGQKVTVLAQVLPRHEENSKEINAAFHWLNHPTFIIHGMTHGDRLFKLLQYAY